MIEIKPIADRKKVEQLFIKNDISLTDNSSGVYALCGEEILGYCLFDLNEKGITVFALYPQDDVLLADGILRSALHVASERSAMDARYADTAPVELLDKLGFITDKRTKTLDIDKLFGGCGCKQ